MTEPMREFSGQFADVMAIAELRGSYPNVPIAPDVDYAALIAGDDNPQFLTIPIAKVNVKSRNERFYDEAFALEIMRQTLADKPVGLMGHLSEAERATAFPKESLHWIGAIREADLIWGKAYLIGEARERVRRYKASGKSIATSIDAHANGVWDESLKAYRMDARTLKLNQIDLAPADRAGIPDLAAVPHLTSEMAAPGEDTQQELEEMDNSKLLQELLKTPVQPTGKWTAPKAASQGNDLSAIRETLGADDKADLVAKVRELQERVRVQEQAAVKSRITELVNEGVKLESVRGLVTELISARNPQTPQEAENAYTQVMAMQAVQETLSATVRTVMGPPQRARVQPKQGSNHYFNIPTEAN